MVEFWLQIGQTMSDFTSVLAQIWEWLITPLNLGMFGSFPPIAILGWAFAIVIAIIVVKEAIF